jgi:ribosomal protein S12 methylthiotransferase
MTYYLDAFGCVKNQVDAENMMAFLNGAGWEAAESAEHADLIIVNSCGFIRSAKQESVNAVLLWKKLYPEKKVLLAGCLAQRYAKELAASLPEADGLFGVSGLSGIVLAAETAVTGRALSKRGPSPFFPGRRPLLSPPGSAYVKISEGCDNRCSFCAIPAIRGGLRSRSVQDIREECGALLERGIKELCLIGQDTGSFGRDRASDSTGLPELLETISRIKGDFRVRLLYIHPDHFPLPILDIMAADTRFVPYFDIPFQHGSEKILKAMNRGGNAGTYLDLIDTIRDRLRDAVIRTTFLTGFPGETGEDFKLLLDFQKKAELDWLGCFAYSREENTPAWGMKGRVPVKTAEERKRLVEETQIPITEKQMDRFIGRTFDVLVEEKFEPPEGPDQTIFFLGRLPGQAPEADGSAVITGAEDLELGAMVPCRIIARRGFDLEAEPV